MSSVASKNLFALLDEDADHAQVDDTSKVAQPAPVAEETPTNNKNPRGRSGPASRGGRYYQRGGARSSPVIGDTQEEPVANDNRNRRVDGDDRGRGRGRGRGGRGAARGGGGAPRRGREFDRQSGTLPDSEKRVQQGWGGENGTRELENEESAIADAKAEGGNVSNDWGADATATPAADTNDWAGTGAAAAATNEDGWGTTAETPAATNTAAAEGGEETGGRKGRRFEEEEEDNTLTLDQYLAQRKEKENELLPKLEGVRKANEGSDETLWKNAVQVAKNDEEGSYFVGKTKSAPKARAKKAEKEVIEIEAKFERPARGGGRGRGRGDGGDRGERRGGRGRGRGGDRGANRSFGHGGGAPTSNINMDDQSAFPSLS